MSWLLLEAGVALALLILIVWWTMPRSSGKPDKEKTPLNKDGDT